MKVGFLILIGDMRQREKLEKYYKDRKERDYEVELGGDVMSRWLRDFLIGYIWISSRQKEIQIEGKILCSWKIDS